MQETQSQPLQEVSLQETIEYYFDKDVTKRLATLVDFFGQPVTELQFIQQKQNFERDFKRIVAPFLERTARLQSSTEELTLAKTALLALVDLYEPRVKNIAHNDRRPPAMS